MARPVTLFTGQWADLPLEELAKMASDWGYDGLELACWGDHFDPDTAADSKDYCNDRHALLDKYGLKCWAISHHLAGQLVLDNIDERHYGFAPDKVAGKRFTYVGMPLKLRGGTGSPIRPVALLQKKK